MKTPQPVLPSSSSNDEILINHQDLKNLAAEKDVLVSDKRRTNIGQRTKNHKEKTKTKREKVGKKESNIGFTKFI